MTGHPESMRAADLLLRAAREIGQCRNLVSAVEHAVEHLPGAGWHRDLQGIDLLHQTLDDIAAFLCAIATAGAVAPVEIPDADDLIAPLRLGAVRARLREADQTVHQDPQTLRSGTDHVELF